MKDILGGGKKFGNENIWSDIIKDVDADGNGEISFDEFKEMMYKLLKNEIQQNNHTNIQGNEESDTIVDN